MSLNSENPSPGTVVYWNGYYDGTHHCFAVYEAGHWWDLMDNSYLVHPPEDAVVIYLGGSSLLSAEEYNETMYQHYKQKRYTYK